MHYFKTCENLPPIGRTHSLINEVFVSYLSKKCGFKCVDAHLAEVEIAGKKLLGVLTPSFAEVGFDSYSLKKFIKPYLESERIQAEENDDPEKLKLVEYKIKHFNMMNNAEDTLKAIGFFLKNEGYHLEDYSADEIVKLETDLVNLCILDFFINNEDRHADNIEIMVPQNDESKFLKLAPTFDNELSFMDENFDISDLLFKLNHDSFWKNETEYMKQIISYIKENSLNDSKSVLKNLGIIDLDSELIYCLCEEFDLQLPEGIDESFFAQIDAKNNIEGVYYSSKLIQSIFKVKQEIYNSVINENNSENE